MEINGSNSPISSHLVVRKFLNIELCRIYPLLFTIILDNLTCYLRHPDNAEISNYEFQL